MALRERPRAAAVFLKRNARTSPRWAGSPGIDRFAGRGSSRPGNNSQEMKENSRWPPGASMVSAGKSFWSALCFGR